MKRNLWRCIGFLLLAFAVTSLVSTCITIAEEARLCEWIQDESIHEGVGYVEPQWLLDKYEQVVCGLGTEEEA